MHLSTYLYFPAKWHAYQFEGEHCRTEAALSSSYPDGRPADGVEEVGLVAGVRVHAGKDLDPVALAVVRARLNLNVLYAVIVVIITV